MNTNITNNSNPHANKFVSFVRIRILASRKGFTLFFAMLVSSLALAVGLAIFDLTIREIDLSATVAQSEYAIYAADTGAECALYWDFKYTNAVPSDADGSAFATSSDWSHGGTGATAPLNTVTCNAQDIVAGSTYAPNFSPGAWAVLSDPTDATTTFLLTLATSSTAISSTTPCALVTVAKYGTPAQTTVTSHGYNTCVSGGLQLERALQVTY